MAKKASEERDPKEKSEASHKRTVGDTVGETASEISSQAKDAAEKVYRLAKNMRRDTAAYILLAAGIVLLYWLPLLGGALVGIVFGVYFSEELMKGIKSGRTFFDREGRARTIVLAGTALGLFIVAPTMVLGAIAAVGVVALLARSSV